MKFVSYDIQYGFGLDGRYAIARATELIRERYGCGFPRRRRRRRRPAGQSAPATRLHIASEDGRDTRRIDCCFVSGEFASRVRRAWIDTEVAASGHKPVWIEIDL